MSEIVSDDMVARAHRSLMRAMHGHGLAALSPEIVREAITAALSPPEDRACLCGCPHERTGNSRFFNDACRTRHWKAETGYVKPSRQALENGRNGTESAKSTRSRPGGLQVALGPCVKAWAKYLSAATPLTAREALTVAERVTTSALSRRQRTRAGRLRAERFRSEAL